MFPSKPLATAALRGSKGGRARVPKGIALSARAAEIRALAVAARSIPKPCPRCGTVCSSGRKAKAHCAKSEARPL